MLCQLVVKHNSSIPNIGQEAWVRKLKWPQMKQFNRQKWKALYVSPESTDTAAFHKSYENLAFYWILKAGHMVNSTSAERQKPNISQVVNGVSVCFACIIWLIAFPHLHEYS